MYKPRDSENLVLYLKDINLPKPDMYDSCMVIAFLQQLITFRGFYDRKLDFLGLDKNIQLVATMNPATTVGRHPLSTRFTAIARLGAIDYPEPSELKAVYNTFLQAAISTSPYKDPKWSAPGNVEQLAQTMVDV